MQDYVPITVILIGIDIVYNCVVALPITLIPKIVTPENIVLYTETVIELVDCAVITFHGCEFGAAVCLVPVVTLIIFVNPALDISKTADPLLVFTVPDQIFGLLTIPPELYITLPISPVGPVLPVGQVFPVPLISIQLALSGTADKQQYKLLSPERYINEPVLNPL